MPRPEQKPPFEVVFLGYSRAEVDDHVAEISRQMLVARNEVEDQRTELQRLRTQLQGTAEETARLRSALESAESSYHRIEEGAAGAEAELANAKADLSRLRERLAILERDQDVLPETLRAAQMAAENMRREAREEARRVLRDAEDRAQRLDETTRERGAALAAEFEQMRGEYQDFLDNARRLAMGFVTIADSAAI